MRRRLLLGACVLALVAGDSLAADEQPYFRFGSGAGETGPRTPGAGTDSPVDPTPPSTSLAFGSASPIPTGATRDSRTGVYSATGGTAPYTMTLANAPASLVLSPSSPDGSSYTLSGDLGPTPNTYRTARITLTDAKAASTSVGVPFDVLGGVEKPGPASPTIVAEDLPASINAGSRTYARASVTGGTSPYTWTLTNAPDTMVVSASPNSPAGDAVLASASVARAGTYQGVVLNVRDAVGLTASYTFGPFEIRPYGPATPVAIGPIEAPPATLAPGSTWTSAPFTVTGGPGSGYTVYLEGGPTSGNFTVNPASPGTYTLTLSPGAADIGRYAGMMVVAREPQDATEAIAPVGQTSVPAALPLTLVDQPGPYNVDPGQFSPIRNGGFKGGSGSYAVDVFGIPADGTVFFGAYEQDSSDHQSRDVMMYAYGTTPKTYKDILISIRDTRTGERIDLTRFDVTVGQPTAVAGGAIASCTTAWADPPMTIMAYDTLVNWDGIRVSGGEPPFTASYSSAGIPAAIGFAIDASKLYAVPDGTTGIEMSLRPTAAGDMQAVPITIQDSKGTSCTVNVSAHIQPKGPRF